MKWIRQKDLISGAAIIVLAGILFWGAQLVKTSDVGQNGAKLVPTLLSGVLLVLGVLVLWDGCKAAIRQPASSQAPAAAKIRREDLPVYLTFGLLAAYVFLIEWAGYLIATAVYMTGQMYVLSCFNRKKLPFFLVISVVGSAIAYYLFRNAFHVLLPAGLLV
ncbi:MAG: tripartite tricarboxylate transporter TctB family protein [Eubacteriales bacterium]|jgi:putative tricarboxylic transport membrane protein